VPCELRKRSEQRGLTRAQTFLKRQATVFGLVVFMLPPVYFPFLFACLTALSIQLDLEYLAIHIALVKHD
jgi:hypothetical protein